MKLESYNNSTILKIITGSTFYYYHVTTNSVIPFSSPILLSLVPDLGYQIGCAEFCIPVPPIDDDDDGCCEFAILSNDGSCLLANNSDCLEHNGGAI